MYCTILDRGLNIKSLTLVWLGSSDFGLAKLLEDIRKPISAQDWRKPGTIVKLRCSP